MTDETDYEEHQGQNIFNGECICEHEEGEHGWGECVAEMPDGTTCSCEAGWEE